MKVEPFFDYARKRHEIYLRRNGGLPREEWTDDEILQTYRFTNVFREYDKTTRWFRDHGRDPYRNDPHVLLSTVVFRLLNRIEVGEAIFCQTTLERGSNETPFLIYSQEGDVRVLKRAIKALLPHGPYVTGAYIISSPAGLPKLDGMLKIIHTFYKKSEWRKVARAMATERWTLETAWNWLREFEFFGKFHSYEMVTDLRHTALLSEATDVNMWANIGPGCRRGLNRLIFGKKHPPRKMPDSECLEHMSKILECSRSKKYWPHEWSTWEMREVEHTLCEFDKYERVRKNEGRPRGVYR